MYTFFHGTKILIISNANSFFFLTNGSGLCNYWKHQIFNTKEVPKSRLDYSNFRREKTKPERNGRSAKTENITLVSEPILIPLVTTYKVIHSFRQYISFLHGTE